VTEAVSKYKAKTDGCTSLNKTVAWVRESKGIRISRCTLDDARKSGKAPLKRGKSRNSVVPELVEKHLHETVVAARAQNLPVFKELVIGNLMILLEGTVEEETHFSKDGVLSMSKFNSWYYSWLKAYQLNSESVKPIEVERATWTTPANLTKHFDVIEKVAIERGYGVANTDYDESDPSSPRLLWTKPERVFSFDEKKLTLDQNSKNMSNTNRTLTVPAMGDTGKCVATHTTQVASGLGLLYTYFTRYSLHLLPRCRRRLSALAHVATASRDLSWSSLVAATLTRRPGRRACRRVAWSTRRRASRTRHCSTPPRRAV